MPLLTRPPGLEPRSRREDRLDDPAFDAEVAVDAGPDATDPRFRARRIAVHRARVDRRRRVLRTVLIAVTVVAVAYGLSRSALLDIDTVELRGADRTSADAIAGATGLVAGLPLLDVDLAESARRIEALPWVLHATVERSWWGTVTIVVTERAAFAQVPDGSRHLVVDAAGRVLDLAGAADTDLITIDTGETAAPGAELGRSYRDAAAVGGALTPGVRSRVAAVRVAPDGNLTLALRAPVTRTGPATVIWGVGGNTDAKVRSLTTTLGQVDLTGLCTIDVRVPATPVVTRDC